MSLKITFTFLLIINLIAGNSIYSPFNSKKIENSESYEFIVSGHFYGSGSNKTGYPINSILANLEFLNNESNSFIMCLGDLFMDISNDIPFYKKSFFSHLKTPLLNSVGNHDLTKDIYENNYGETFYSFELGNDIHLILDSEIDDGKMKNNQLELIKSVFEKVKNGSFSNLFIYSHRTLWSRHYSQLDNLFKNNTQSIIGNNFSSEVYPLLESVKNKINIFWFSGSIGNAPSSFFYFNPDDKITYIASAVRGLKRDAILKVKVIDGNTSFETIPFTSQQVENLEFYNVEFWNENFGETSFNYRLIPLYIKNTLIQKTIWIGFGIGILITLAFFYLKKKKSIK